MRGVAVQQCQLCIITIILWRGCNNPIYNIKYLNPVYSKFRGGAIDSLYNKDMKYFNPDYGKFMRG